MATGAALIAQMERLPILPGSLAIWGLGQMGVAIKGPDGLLYIDPCLSDSVREQGGDWWVRAFAPPLLPDDITNASALLASHEHGDHFDTATLGPAAAASPQAVVITTGWTDSLCASIGLSSARVIVPRIETPFTVPGTSARITALPSAHYQLEADAERGHRWLGYLIEWNGVTFYHSGDTVIYAGYAEMLRRYPTADVAMLPVNGRDWYREADVGAIGNLWPAEAARLADDLGFGLVLAGHNDLYPNNTLSMGSLAEAFARYAPRQPYKILQPGELLYFVK
jgi:L-ascorbate metabolism protein UlaG (beta-lactamase superfamily)